MKQAAEIAPMAPSELPGDYLRMPQVRALVGNPTAKSVYDWISRHGFPRGFSLAGGKVVVWKRSEVVEWIERQPRAGGNAGKTGLSRSEAVRLVHSQRNARRTATKPEAA